MTISKAVIATHRFGLGPSPGDLEQVKTDPESWILRQIGIETSVSFLSSVEVLDLQSQNRQARISENQELRQQINQQMRAASIADAAARTRLAIDSDTPFVERLVHFWSNHFAISVDKAAIVGMGGSFEGEAIRPNIFGRFEDLLMASTKHPGMLLYLDNGQSTGPESRSGSRGNRDLNENLAREILELHTLGVNTGYSQEDVTNFAKVITGWSVATAPAAEHFGDVDGSFAYIDISHEPGRHTVLNKAYRQTGKEQGEAVLRDLAVHPKTAKHIATKLARHFIADEPPISAVEALTKSFVDTEGDLPSIYRTLIELDEVWQEASRKFRTPSEWLMANLRAMQYEGSQARRAQVRDNQLVVALDTLGQPIWRPGSPAGWPDIADRWTSPDSLGKRIEWANAMSQQIDSNLPAETLVQTLYGHTASENLTKAVSRAKSNAQALVLVAMAPVSLRR